MVTKLNLNPSFFMNYFWLVFYKQEKTKITVIIAVNYFEN